MARKQTPPGVAEIDGLISGLAKARAWLRDQEGQEKAPDLEAELAAIDAQEIVDIRAAIGRAERARKSAHTRTGMWKAKQAGRVIGAVPIGSCETPRPDGKRGLVPLPREQVVIAIARKLRADGLSLRKIAAELDRKGYHSRAGKVFDPAQIRAMCAGSQE